MERGSLFAFAALLCACGGSTGFDVAKSDASVTDGSSSDGSITETTTPSDTATTETSADSATPTKDSGFVCGDMSTFPKFDDGCGSTANCSFGLHQIDCCGSKKAIGFNHAFRTSFDMAESGWEAACPAACDCLAKPTVADDGSSGSTITVECKSGKCVTSAK